MSAGCPLCGQRDAAPRSALPYDDVWRALEAEIGRDVPASLRAKYQPTADAVLVECTECGLQYFDPLNAGAADFYEFLSGHDDYYFDVQKWEFGRVAALVGRASSVLDVGCGNGTFLRTIAPDVSKAVGIDTNVNGIQRLIDQGLEADCVTVEEFASHNAGSFDVVCIFQVIEHLDAILPFITSAAACAHVGGQIFISTPNRDRARIGDIDPFEFPPHHVSRWDAAAMEELAQRAGLEVTGIDVQRRTPSSLLRAAPAVARRLPARLRARSDVPETAHGTGHRTSVAQRLRSLTYDHTLLARLRRP